MAISIRPLHRSYCPLSCACVGARRAAGGVLFTIVKVKERGGLDSCEPFFFLRNEGSSHIVPLERRLSQRVLWSGDFGK